MKNVTDRTSNPFGMDPPCEHACAADVPAVFGYGDANADVHVIGDHPGVHGGTRTGVPFTGCDAGRAVQSVLRAVDLLADPGDSPDLRNCFLSYLHTCCPPDGQPPSEAAYAEMEPFFDAELRAIAAHVLVPVGERAIRHAFAHYTARRTDEIDVRALHGTEVRGSGWLLLPLSEPADWTTGDRERAVEGLAALLERDYRQTTDLGRFLATEDSYLVR